MADIIKNAVTDAMLTRRSIRSYKPEQISDAELETVLSAGIWAPTARNEQSIKLYVVQSAEVISKIAEGFSTFAFDDGKIRDFAYGAPTLILLYGKTGGRYMETDAGIVVENMSLTAHSLGLGSLIIGCIKEYLQTDAGRAFSSSLGVPEDYSFSIALAVGKTAAPTPAKPRLDGRITYIR